jgi:hypothetical protein
MNPRTVSFNPGMQITNTAQLPRGTGAKYLEVIDNGNGPFIAVQWRRVKPKSLKNKRRLLIKF